MTHKVLITTSGVGQRLGEITKYTNKALVRIGKKPAISYVIEAYPADTDFVVTIGYFADQVKEFLSLAYPDRNIEYIEVDNYVGPGSSLGYSMLQAKKSLQCPFIYHAVDTLVSESIPAPDTNWVGVYNGDDTSQYASWQDGNGGKLIFGDKGAIDFDYIHIGLVGIHDYKEFWKDLESLYKSNPGDESLNDCRVIVEMIEKGNLFSLKEFPQWHDIGNTAALQRAREEAVDHFDNLDKLEEAVFIFDDFVIKFFFDENIAQERVERAHSLSGLVPPLEGVTKHFYKYTYIKGDLYANVAAPSDFVQFLDWAKENLWHDVHEVDDVSFKRACKDFYLDKTKKRVAQFLEANNLTDEEHIINGERVPSISDMLSHIDFDWLTDTTQSQFHGDFIIDNVVKTPDGYCLIDWRHNFGGLLNAGDRYYDLSKLNHNLTVNHELVNENLFSVSVDTNGNVFCEILRKNNLVECQQTLFDFVEREGYDAKKIRLLTGIIWLNMSPLHHHPFNLFLYYFGKLHLWKAINS